MVQLHVMEKQFFKQLLQKLDLRFNKDTTSHMSFTMWHELQGWVTSVIVKLKCSAVTLYLCHRCGATVKLYCCCTQAGSVWPVTAANWEIWFLHLLNAAATSCRHTEAFSVFTDIFTAYFAYIAHPSCACCMWPALHRAIHQLVGRRWHLLSCHDCVWLCDPHKVIMCLTFSRIKSTKCQRHNLHNIQQTDLHTYSELLLCIKLKSPANMTKSFYFRQILFFTQSLSASEWTWNQFTVKGAICCVIMHYIIW